LVNIFHNLEKKHLIMSEIKNLIQKLIEFRNERDWQQFHNSKDLALAINIEAGELLELFLWKDNEDVNKEKLEEELADVLSFCLLLAEKHNLDVTEIIEKKIKENDKKYPVEKAKGTSKKYNEL
jgi:NTP pyrophosphatase (non-canonical NTP hydrolase)